MNTSSHVRDQIPVEPALRALGELLAADGLEERVVVVGGAALSLLGFVERTTRDVDVIARAEGHGPDLKLVTPVPLSPALADGIATVARDLGLSGDWMNTTVGMQWRTGMPPGLGPGELEWRVFDGLRVGLPNRLALICMKLYASADHGPSSRHVHDLIALAPDEPEFTLAAEWIATQDPTLGPLVEKATAHVRAQLR